MTDEYTHNKLMDRILENFEKRNTPKDGKYSRVVRLWVNYPL
jgi:hypothetical protein